MGDLFFFSQINILNDYINEGLNHYLYLIIDVEIHIAR